MRYLLRTNTGYEHLAKKFKRAVLTHVGRDGSEMAACMGRRLCTLICVIFFAY